MSNSDQDVLAQIGVSIFGVIAIILVARKNKWGFVFGLLSQPFWVLTSYLNSQWGVLLLSIIYTGSWIYGIYEWFFKKAEDRRSYEPTQQEPTAVWQVFAFYERNFSKSSGAGDSKIYRLPKSSNAILCAWRSWRGAVTVFLNCFCAQSVSPMTGCPIEAR